MSPHDELRRLAKDGLLRSLRPLDSASGVRIRRDGRELWNFSANDYLGLAQHPALADAMIEGVQRYGSGAAASRLVSGSLPPHQQLEEQLAMAKGCEAAMLFSSGFATAIGVIPAVCGHGDFVILDKLAHACLVDAARLSKATLRVFRHNDVDMLAAMLEKIRTKNPSAGILVVTESVFSMDGDLCPLRDLVELTERFNARLLLDEAHGIGVLGKHGMGLAEHEGLQDRISFQMGTLSKAAGLSGGYITATRSWIDLLVNRARSFIYTTATPPALAHAAIAALNIIRSAEGSAMRQKLQSHIEKFANSNSPIIPWILGENHLAIAAAQSLQDAGFLVPAIRYPTVARGSARLRISLSAAHPDEAVSSLRDALAVMPQAAPK
ncbi:MAG: aminotransferase class I/II-fold pyridoxal phosphate-dependent enzyme [Luteolibacter sp.]